MRFDDGKAEFNEAETRLFGFKHDADDPLTLHVDALTLMGLNAVLKANIDHMRDYVTDSARRRVPTDERKLRFQELVDLQNERYEIVTRFGEELLVQCFAESIADYEASSAK